MWLPNALTLSRIPLGILFWFVLDRGHWDLVVLLVGAATDLVDGPIARAIRKHRGEPPVPPGGGLGSWLDPLCDKFFVLSVLIATAVVRMPPAYVILLIALREIVLVPLAAIYRLMPSLRRRMRYNFTAGRPGKLATVAQVLALAMLLTRQPHIPIFAVVAGVIGAIAAVYYIRRGVAASSSVTAAARRVQPVNASPETKW